MWVCGSEDWIFDPNHHIYLSVTEKSFHLLTFRIHKIGSKILTLLTSHDMNQVIFCKRNLNTVNAKEKEMLPNLKIIHFEFIRG